MGCTEHGKICPKKEKKRKDDNFSSDCYLPCIAWSGDIFYFFMGSNNYVSVSDADDIEFIECLRENNLKYIIKDDAVYMSADLLFDLEVC